jgi:hypothetical protein
VCLKNICDGVGGQDESNGIPLNPPLFWLDIIFNRQEYTWVVLLYSWRIFIHSRLANLRVLLHGFTLHKVN